MATTTTTQSRQAAPTGWAALLTPYTAQETAERYQAVREAEARRAAALASPR